MDEKHGAARDVSRQLLEAMRDKLESLGRPGMPISQDVLVMGLAETLRDVISMCSVEAQKELIPDVLRKVVENSRVGRLEVYQREREPYGHA